MPNISRELRKQRRAAERKTRKQPNNTVSMSEPAPASARADINRQNAEHSTGPKTVEGKAASSRNAVRHGLASNHFYILPWEQIDDFDGLLDNLRAEHQPQTQTEALLVEQLAQYFWLTQRALRLQGMCFQPDLPVCDQPKDLTLYIRYQATNERAFHKALKTLKELQKSRGFVPQNVDRPHSTQDISNFDIAEVGPPPGHRERTAGCQWPSGQQQASQSASSLLGSVPQINATHPFPELLLMENPAKSCKAPTHLHR